MALPRPIIVSSAAPFRRWSRWQIARNPIFDVCKKEPGRQRTDRAPQHLVGVTRFELVTSSVSGKRSPPELNARTQRRNTRGK